MCLKRFGVLSRICTITRCEKFLGLNWSNRVWYALKVACKIRAFKGDRAMSFFLVRGSKKILNYTRNRDLWSSSYNTNVISYSSLNALIHSRTSWAECFDSNARTTLLLKKRSIPARSSSWMAIFIGPSLIVGTCLEWVEVEPLLHLPHLPQFECWELDWLPELSCTNIVHWVNQCESSGQQNYVWWWKWVRHRSQPNNPPASNGKPTLL